MVEFQLAITIAVVAVVIGFAAYFTYKRIQEWRRK
jgi:hypothetical protein